MSHPDKSLLDLAWKMRRCLPPNRSFPEALEEYLFPVVSRVLETGRGQPGLVVWVNNHRDKGKPSKVDPDPDPDPDRDAAAMARQLSEEMLEEMEPRSGRETVVGM